MKLITTFQKMSYGIDFPNIRSENTHENGAVVDGISPKYFAIVCRLVGMEYGGGSNLIKSERY